ncbi:MAG TPA: hypothetical protein VD713_07915 [Sphingomonadales bacterium]|nr:hypothetical protein [Sphingomonadales bacterium]
MTRLLMLAGFLMALAAAPAMAAEKAFSKEVKAMLGEYFGLADAVPDQYDNRVDNAHGKGKGGKKSSLPPGLAKRDELPPGLAKMETLPPGLASRDLPPGLLAGLPPLPQGTKAKIVDQDKVVLVEEKSGKVLDILPGKIPSNFDEAKAEKAFKASRDMKLKGSKVKEN